MNSYFLEVVCKLIYVEAEVLHANLSDLERVNLVNRFNNPGDTLIVLIIIYQVSFQGVNLDNCCCRVVVAMSALNAPPRFRLGLELSEYAMIYPQPDLTY